MPSLVLPTPVEPVPVVPIQLPAIVTLSATAGTMIPSRANRVSIRPRTVLPSPVADRSSPLNPPPRPVEAHNRRGGEVGLGRAVDDERVVESRERRPDGDRVRPDAGNIEEDEIGVRGAVRRRDRLAQRNTVPARRADQRGDGGRRAVDRVVRVRDDERLTHRRDVRGELRGLDRFQCRVELRRRGRDHRPGGHIGHELRAPRRVPDAFVRTLTEPRYVCPSPLPEGRLPGWRRSRCDRSVRVAVRASRPLRSVARVRHGAGEHGEVLEVVDARRRRRPGRWR